MKQLFSIIAMTFFALSISKAQNNDYADRTKQIFKNIDVDKVTSGYLKDFGIRFADLEKADGKLTADNYVSNKEWRFFYKSLFTMKVGLKAIEMKKLTEVSSLLDASIFNNDADVIMAVLHYEYQQYKTDAYANGDVKVINEQIYDVAGRDPYETNTVFAAVPHIHRLEGDTFTFRVPSDLVFNNIENPLASVSMNFDNGQGSIAIDIDSNVLVSYQSGGIKKIITEFNYEDGTSVLSHSQIEVNYIDPTVPLDYDAAALLSSALPVQGAVYEGESATGFVTIELAPGHSNIIKPLIVVEGFDPDNRFNYANLITSLRAGGLGVDLDPNPTTFTSLNQAIENEGFDLIFIDFANSTDYIQRNALMVEEVIRRVNALKVGDEKNVVLGMSMGGLVARYALRHMEQEGETHETGLYISHDSPHQGANVPLSLQALVRHLAGEQVAIPVFFGLFDIGIDLDRITDAAEDLEDGLELLQSPAAQQMLIYQIDGTGGEINHVGDNTLHNSFLAEYQEMGYPQQDNIRNIAIANGTDCGTPLDFEPYDQIINGEVSFANLSSLNFLLAIGHSILINPGRAVTALLSTSTDVRGVMECRALPDQEFKRIYRGEVIIRKKVLGFIEVNEPLMETGIFHSTQEMLALDNANGGIYDVSTFASIPDNFEPLVLQERFNFVPAYSSLDVGQGNVNITPNDLIAKYDATMPPSAPRDIPFDNFFTNPIRSESHIQFTLNNGNWLLEELQQTPDVTSCAIVCEFDNWEITGPNSFCDRAIFSVPAGAPEYNWSYPGVITVPDPSQPNVIEVQEWLNGYHTLSVNFGNYPKCNIRATDTRISKRVHSGVPKAGGDLR